MSVFRYRLNGKFFILEMVNLIMRKSKKAVSPVISTVLLIMIVIILAIIILLWSRGFISEVVEKEIAGSIKRVDDYCKEVKLSSIINQDGSFGFENVGNVPIFAYNVKLTRIDSGESTTVKFENKNGGAVNPSFGSIISDQGRYDEYEKVKIIPILLGKAKGGTKEFTCPEDTSFVI